MGIYKNEGDLQFDKTWLFVSGSDIHNACGMDLFLSVWQDWWTLVVTLPNISAIITKIL